MAKCSKITKVTIGYMTIQGKHIITWAEDGKRLPFKEASRPTRFEAGRQLLNAMRYWTEGKGKGCYEVKLTAAAKKLLKR
jgi:hypothetical protein